MKHNIEIDSSGKLQRFVVRDGSDVLAELTFTVDDQVMKIRHTGVEDALKGQSVGSHLVRRAAEYAIEEKLKILPYCTFAKAWLDRHKDEFGALMDLPRS